MAEKESNTENSELQDSFWFNREEDEVFKGNLSNRRITDQNRASKAYAEFLATSTRLSLVSFTPSNPNVMNTKIKPRNLDPTFIAAEMLPEIPEPPTWRQWFYGRKVLVFTTIVAIAGALVLGFFTIPVTELNNEEQSCTVFEANALSVQCENGEVGYCIQQTVAVPAGDGLFQEGVLQGFDVLKETGTGTEVDCVVSNCTSDPLTELAVRVETLNEVCIETLTQENRTADELSDSELLACSFLSLQQQCVRLSESDSIFKTTYFDVRFDDGEAVSIPKQPSKDTVIAVTVPVFAILFVLILASVYESRKPVVGKGNDQDAVQTQNQNEVNAIVALPNPEES